MTDDAKPLFWIASCKRDLMAFPDEVKDVIGFALDLAQRGGKHSDAKPLKGYKGSAVLEIVDDHDGDTYRAIYTVRFEGAVFALHAFQKKSKSGKTTPKADMDKVASRLKRAEEFYAEWQKERKAK